MTEHSPDRRRRRFVQAAAGALVVGTAGCSALEDEESEAPEMDDVDVESLRERFADEADADDGTVALGIGFAEDHLPTTSELYEPDPDASVSDTDDYETTDLSDVDLVEGSGEELPTVDDDEITLYSIELEPGETRTMALAVQSDEEQDFYAEPPEGEPYEMESGLVLNCYCIDETWHVPAEGTWSRVIEIGVEEDVDDVEPAVAVYNVFGED